MTVRQFVAVRFRDGGRTYTYHNDGQAVRVGDVVKVPGRSADDGWQRADVVRLVDPPTFETKAILGVISAELRRPVDAPTLFD